MATKDTKKTEKQEIILVDDEYIKGKIYIVRGQNIMLDADLAKIYGYSTKAFNQQVKNNAEKFEDDFCFRLTKEELDELRSNYLTANISTMSRSLPLAFTEAGVYMLMTVLKGELAVNQSKALIRVFKRMKDYIFDGQRLIDERHYIQLSMQTTENTREIAEMKRSLNNVEGSLADVVNSLGEMVTKSELSGVMESFVTEDFSKSFLLLNGKPFQADLAYESIYKRAKKTIYHIDNYIGAKTLMLLGAAKEKVKIIIFSDNLHNGLHAQEYADYCAEHPNVSIAFQRTGRKVHDRYIVLDYGLKSEKVYICGGSAKDSGGKLITAIEEVHDTSVYHQMIDNLLKNPELILK